MIYLLVIISLLALYLLFDNLRQKFAASEFKSEREAYRQYALEALGSLPEATWTSNRAAEAHNIAVKLVELEGKFVDGLYEDGKQISLG